MTPIIQQELHHGSLHHNLAAAGRASMLQKARVRNPHIYVYRSGTQKIMGAIRIPSLMVPIHHSMEQLHLQKMAYIKTHRKNPQNLRVKGCNPIASRKFGHSTSNNNRSRKKAQAPIAIMWLIGRLRSRRYLSIGCMQKLQVLSELVEKTPC